MPGRNGGKKKKYSFADDAIATDTKIALVNGGLSLLITVVTLVVSALQGGVLPDRAGILLLMSLVMAVTGLVFGLLSYRVVEGDNNYKHLSVLVSVIAILLLVVLIII